MTILSSYPCHFSGNVAFISGPLVGLHSSLMPLNCVPFVHHHWSDDTVAAMQHGVKLCTSIAASVALKGREIQRLHRKGMSTDEPQIRPP